MFVDEPYFMSNEDWYHFDSEKGIFVIEDDAPQSAKDSYKEFYKELNRKHD